MKEAQASVLEPYLGASEFDHHGERVVRGQRMDQAVADLSTMRYWGLHAYSRACGWSLARAHARSGDRCAIASYLGGGANFDEAIARFSAAYADQNELDYERLIEAVHAGEVPAQFNV